MKPFKDRLAWSAQAGTIADGPARYVLIRADALMGLFHNLSGADRRTALAAFQRSVHRFGGQSVRRYQAARNEDDPDVLTLVAAGAPQLGWGHWTVERHGAALSVIVENSPFASGFGDAGQSVCAPIAGMLEAAATITLDREFSVTEVRCAAAGSETCHFELVPICRSGRDI